MYLYPSFSTCRCYFLNEFCYEKADFITYCIVYCKHTVHSITRTRSNCRVNHS